MVSMKGLGAGNQQGWRKGPWSPQEDKLLSEYVKLHGEGRWSSASTFAGLKRSGKSCRLRWVNYLRPGLKRGQLTPQEEAIIIELHALWGNKWSTIARYLPGRTDNEIKNYWRTQFQKKEKSTQKQEERRAQNLLKQNNQNQEVVHMNNMEEEFFPMMGNDVKSWVDSVVEDYGQLWNLDEPSFQYDHTRNCSKIAVQNQTNLGGEVNNIYNGGYIF